MTAEQPTTFVAPRCCRCALPVEQGDGVMDREGRPWHRTCKRQNDDAVRDLERRHGAYQLRLATEGRGR